MAMWDRRVATLVAGSTAAQARHLCRRPRLIDKDELFRIKIKLALEPGFPLSLDVGVLLLGGVRRFF